MKSCGLFSIVVALSVCACFCQLRGSNYVEKLLLCALERAPCDAFGKQIRSALPEIIGNGCRFCDASQVTRAARIAKFVQRRYPDAWEELVDKYSR